MKILTILLILLQINTFSYGNYSSTYSNNRYSSGNVPVEQEYRGIGYSTKYSNGQFNSGVYKSSMTTLEYQNRTFTGTYNPSSSSSGGSRPGGPRKVHGYTGGGEYVGDNNGDESDFWKDGYEYYWDDIEKCWYRYGDDGWRKYTNTLGFLLGWHWALTSWGGRTRPSNPVFQSYEENPVPIGDAIVPLLILLLLYIGYDVFKKKSVKKHK